MKLPITESIQKCMGNKFRNVAVLIDMGLCASKQNYPLEIEIMLYLQGILVYFG